MTCSRSTYAIVCVYFGCSDHGTSKAGTRVMYTQLRLIVAESCIIEELIMRIG